MPRSDVVVLDTDAWSHLYTTRRREHPEVPLWRHLLTSRLVVIATQTRAEVLTRLMRHVMSPARERSIRAVLTATATAEVDEPVVQAYARLTAGARDHGHGIGGHSHTGDRWIAATAIALDAPLLAVDGIYRNAPGLTLLWQEDDG